MKYGELSEKILETIYQEPDLRISENSIISTFSIGREKLAPILQYLKKCEYIKISGNISCFMSGDFSEQYRNEHPDVISLTLKGIKYCEKDKNVIPVQVGSRTSEVNILSITKNNIERNSIEGSQNVWQNILSFFINLFHK